MDTSKKRTKKEGRRGLKGLAGSRLAATSDKIGYLPHSDGDTMELWMRTDDSAINYVADN